MHARIARGVRLVAAAGVDGGEDHRDVEHLRRRRAGAAGRGNGSRPRRGSQKRSSVSSNPLRFGAKRRGLRRFSRRAKPLDAFVQRGRRDAQREVVVAELLLPDVERRLAPVDGREREVDAQESLGVRQRVCGDGLARASVTAQGAQPAQHGQRAQRRAVVLGARPAGDIERAIGIHARVRVDGVAGNAREVVAAQVLHEVRPHRSIATAATRRARARRAPSETG